MRRISSLFILLALLFSGGAAFGQSVTLDHVDGLVVGDPTKVLVGETVVFHLRSTNDTEDEYIAAGTGFRVYSDDAAWGTLEGEAVNGYNALFDSYYSNSFSVTGEGADTISFSGFSFSLGKGIQPGYDDISYTISIGPIADVQHGKTVCLDSSFTPPGGTWKWNSPGLTVFPSWDGPHCYTIHDPDAPTNQAPELGTIGDRDVDEGNPLTFVVTATDPDGTTPSVSAAPLPDDATFQDNGDGTGTFTWNTDFTDSGDYDVTFTVSDGELTDDETITITVNDVNRAPELGTIGPRGVQADANLNFTVTATDPDGTTPGLSATPVPAGATFTDNGNGTGTFDWTPTVAQVGDHVITFTASDGDLTDDEAVTITVSAEPNEPPVLADVEDQSVNEGDTLTFTVSATDPNETIPALGAEGLPDGATFTDNGDGTGTFEWFTDYDDAGTYEVSFTASDGEFTDADTITITVNDVNLPPVLAEIGPQIVAADSNLNFVVTATDPDGTIPDLSATPLPDGATFTDNDDGTGTFDWTPTAAQSGDYDVTFAATDGEYTDDELVTITVAEAPLVLVVMPDSLIYNVNEGDLSIPSQTIDVSETGGGALDYTASTEAGWIGLTGITGTTEAQVTVDISKEGLAPGSYSDSVKIEAPDAINSPQYVQVSLELTPCPMLMFEDSDFVYIEAVYADTVVAGETSTVSDSLQLTAIFAESLEWASTPSDFFTVTPALGVAPTPVGFSYSRLFTTMDTYSDTLKLVAGFLDDNECVSEVRVIVNVKVNPLPSADTLIVGTTPAIPGMSVVVPVSFTNSCNLTEIAGSIAWTEFLYLDSISFEGTALTDFAHTTSIDYDVWTATFHSAADGAPAFTPNSQQNWLNLHFTVSCDAPDGFYPFGMPFLPGDLFFTRDCGQGSETEIPEVIGGGINVGTTEVYFCGWVAEESTGEEIQGATVEMWVDFPIGSPLMTEISSGIGSFAFDSVGACQFDLWVYKEGYYPQHVEDVDCYADKGIRVELSPVEVVVPPIPSQWVDYYCDDNTYLDMPLPVGSVVEAQTHGLLVGQFFVTQAGLYGFMPVYRASQEFDDDGANTGDTLRFFVNGRAAVATGDVIYPEDYTQVQVCLEAGASVTKECTLVEGWNLVSWNVDTETDDILQVLGDYMDDIEVILGFEQGGLTYDPDLPMFSTLWYVDHLSGYWIKVKQGSSVTLALEGFLVPLNTEIPLTYGWNLVSYLPEDVLTPEEALASIEDHLLFAYGWVDNDIRIYQPGGQFNQLDEMAPCNGYWTKVDAAGLLVYPDGLDGPAVSPAWTRSNVEISTATANSVTPTTNWINLYSSNLKVSDRAVRASSVVSAHAVSDGSMVGSFTLTTDAQFGFMPVYAGDNSPLQAGDRFYLSVDGVETIETFEWTGNGDRVEVSFLTAKGGSDATLPDSYSLDQNYPNPFNPSTAINFTMPIAGHARIEVFNILGALVATPFDGQTVAGTNTVVWDGHDSRGQSVASGVYLYRLTADNYSETKKMMLLK